MSSGRLACFHHLCVLERFLGSGGEGFLGANLGGFMELQIQEGHLEGFFWAEYGCFVGLYWLGLMGSIV